MTMENDNIAQKSRAIFGMGFFSISELAKHMLKGKTTNIDKM